MLTSRLAGLSNLGFIDTHAEPRFCAKISHPFRTSTFSSATVTETIAITVVSCNFILQLIKTILSPYCKRLKPIK